MNSEYLALCKKEIDSLIEKKLIRPSKSPWSCTAFYVNKNAEKERGVPRLCSKELRHHSKGNPCYCRSNPSYRGGSSSRGRGKGNYITNHTNPIVQQGSRKLIAANIAGTSKTELEVFYQWRDVQKNKETSDESLYANVVKRNHSIEADMLPNDKERVILLLNESDKKWDDKPWTLFYRYLKPHNYTMEVYKTPYYYEEILANNGCTFTHFSGANKEIYNFSKIIIGSIISIGA
ncbi:hypothetical protein RND81_14G201700 [Saponaria officinalis]|uniref:Uncharacterized protein n=1 Tax=Saponaria officinalis TaxID=3572 RepID=A0AAW1GPG9_SAPOF